jgi:hypothetical protein
MQGHKDLEAWKVSMEFVTEVYRLTGNFPKEEIYSLTSQLRRAAVSLKLKLSLLSQQSWALPLVSISNLK